MQRTAQHVRTALFLDSTNVIRHLYRWNWARKQGTRGKVRICCKLNARPPDHTLHRRADEIVYCHHRYSIKLRVVDFVSGGRGHSRVYWVTLLRVVRTTGSHAEPQRGHGVEWRPESQRNPSTQRGAHHQWRHSCTGISETRNGSGSEWLCLV